VGNSKRTGAENLGQISELLSLVKITEGIVKVSESLFQAQPRSQSLIYFDVGAVQGGSSTVFFSGSFSKVKNSHSILSR